MIRYILTAAACLLLLCSCSSSSSAPDSSQTTASAPTATTTTSQTTTTTTTTTTATTTTAATTTTSATTTAEQAPKEITLTDTNGQGRDFTFELNGQTFTAEFSYRYDGKENWRVYDSYKITSESDMISVCQALIRVHTIRGKDLSSLRTPQDMAEEWKIHNQVHEMLGEGDIKEHCKDVDFDPDDQGKGYADYFRQYFLDN
ncbi:MAG: hypothetical protein II574_10530 [Ruminococcus sp.]|nr:hypothetical protein [Ruminococcus sp.]